MLQLIIEIPESFSIKDKRRIVKSIKDKLIQKFHLSCAETDLQESMRFAQLGAALVSNSADYGEAVLKKALDVVEKNLSLRVHDSGIHSEYFE